MCVPGAFGQDLKKPGVCLPILLRVAVSSFTVMDSFIVVDAAQPICSDTGPSFWDPVWQNRWLMTLMDYMISL